MRHFYKYFFSFLIFLFFSKPVFSQDISGTWEGNFIARNQDLQPSKLVIEIYLYNDSLITGLSHLYYPYNRYEHYKIEGIYRKKQNLIIIIEVGTIAVDLGPMGNCLGTYVTKLQLYGTSMLQRGWWHANDKFCGSPTMEVWLRKGLPPQADIATVRKVPTPVTKPSPKKITTQPNKAVDKKPNNIAVTPATKNILTPAPEQKVRQELPQIKNIPTPPQILNRQTDVQSLLEIPIADKDSIKVQVYDNGEIDGDSVSVYVDKTVRIYRKKITDKPLTFYVSLNKGTNPISNIRLVAESLGSIPPCTALMIVTTKSKRYEVSLSSNFNKNATVELFLKE